MKCPVCETNTKNNICPICGYSLEHSILDKNMLMKLTEQEIKEYHLQIETHKKLYIKSLQDNAISCKELEVLADYYDNEENYNKAFEFYQKAEKKGSNHALYKLGYFHEHGYPISQDYHKAYQYYYRGMELGNKEATAALADIYRTGLGVSQDYSKAIEYYQKATDLNDGRSAAWLGYLYQEGLGTSIDYDKAVHYYEIGSRLNYGRSSLLLGHMYRYGLGVLVDRQKALDLYLKALADGDEDANASLGNYYFDEQDYNLSFYYYTNAPKTENSLVWLGYFYDNGYGVEENKEIARDYYEQAASKGNARAMLLLGDMYRDGISVKKDKKKARDYYDKALKHDDVLAQERIDDLGVII